MLQTTPDGGTGSAECRNERTCNSGENWPDRVKRQFPQDIRCRPCIASISPSYISPLAKALCAKINPMAVWQKILRAVALMLILIAVHDVLLIDPASASTGGLSVTSGTTKNSDSGPGGCDGDGCYCSCGHIVLKPSPTVIFNGVTGRVSLQPVLSPRQIDPTAIVHPPKA